MHVSRQLSLFYLSHTWLFGTSCYIFSRLTVFSSNASNRTATWRILFTRMQKPFLQAKSASMSSMRVWKRKTDDKRWRKPQYLSSVHGKNYNRRREVDRFWNLLYVKSRTILRQCRTFVSRPCTPRKKMFLR